MQKVAITKTEAKKPTTGIVSRLKQPKTIVAIGCIALFIILAFVIGGFVLTKIGVLPDSALGYVQEYVAGAGNIKGDVDLDYFLSKSDDFAIGANQYGYAVFKDPGKAFKRLKKDYAATIGLIQKEFNLPPLNNLTYNAYKQYSWQITSGSEEEQKRATFVSGFLDIYENSFRRSY